MNHPPSLLRRIAIGLTGHAAGILPPRCSAWAQAMRNEVPHIDSDWDALTWAAGCVTAGYVERSGIGHLLRTWPVRAFLVLLVATQAVSMLFATVMTAAYRLGYLDFAAFLGRFTPGDDYRRFIPLMDATPWFIHALWLSASLLFVVSGWQFFRKHPVAFPLFACAWISGSLGNLLSRSIPAYQQVFSFAHPLLTRDYLIPFATALCPLLIAAALWLHNRHLALQDAQ